MNRVKNSLLNLKSLHALQRNEKTSTAVRHNFNKYEKQLDNSTDSTNSKHSLISNFSDSNLKLKKMPPHPLPASIRFSPLRKLEISTTKLNVSDLNTPSKKSPLRMPDSPRHDTQSNKYIRIKEQLLREREDELEMEEKKLQEILMETPEGQELIPVLQKEIFEYRNLKKSLFKDKDSLEKEKNDLRDTLKKIEMKEKKIQDAKNSLNYQKSQSEQAKIMITGKLEWLKKMLIENL